MLSKPLTNRVISVSELTVYLKALLESDSLLRFVRVRGEVSNLRRPASGHIYFTLKDCGACLRCVLFRRRAAWVPFPLEEGVEVVATGEVSLYERDGLYQLYVEEIEPAGVGSLLVAFQQLKDKLEQEGLFAPERKRTLPPLPRQIAVVTSGSGAALHDILTTIRQRFPAEVVLVPAAVQGEAAPAAIVASLGKAAKQPDVDVIILARGGGSLEELWAFNDERVARAVAASPVPVVTGIGHETDFTIADFVADFRAPTPTGAAQAVVPDAFQMRVRLQEAETRLVRAFNWRAQRIREKMQQCHLRLKQLNPLRRLRTSAQRLDSLEERLCRLGRQMLQQKASKIRHLQERLDTASPLQVMKRGFAFCTDAGGSIIRSVRDIRPGDEIRIRFTDGSAFARVERTEEERS